MGGVGEFVLADVQNGLELEMQSQEINNDDNITSNKIGGHGCRLMQIQAEQILADMEFGPSDHPSERALKLDVVRIYNAKLDGAWWTTAARSRKVRRDVDSPHQECRPQIDRQ